jgi:short-subunit dehydrogenase
MMAIMLVSLEHDTHHAETVESSMSTQNRGIAVVTGASSGIGKVYADRLAKRGYDLLLVARRKDRLDALAKELHAAHRVEVESLEADLADHAQLQRVADVLASNERISMLVNNAGIAVIGASAEIPIEGIENQFDLNARAVQYLSQAILPGFIKRDSGTLINIGSVLSFYAYPFSTAYSATKAHVMLYTIGLRDELAKTHVRVQLVMPSTTRTENVGSQYVDQETVMSAEDLVDAALAGLDRGETVTLPSLEDASLWETFDATRIRMFNEMQTKRPASRYNLGK